MKVIFLGHCSYYTIANFSEALRKNIKNIEITVVNPVKPGGNSITEDELKVFDRVIDFPLKRNIRLTKHNKSESISDIFKNRFKRRILIKNTLLFRFHSVINQIKSNAEEIEYTRILNKLLKDYDIYHYHYLDPEFLLTLKYFSKDKKVLMTFWGSDLFQISGTDNYKKQIRALNRADLITVNAIEIKETMLSKFGRNLESKVRYADFGLNNSRLDMIDQRDKTAAESRFRRKYGIPEDKIIIAVGYSGSSKQRHIEILNIMEKLKPEIKEKIFAVLPLTYGLQYEKGNYLQKVKDVCSSAGFGSLVLDKFMTPDELADFIISSKIKLNLRETDAMNAAMLESLYAGSIVINGSWLPYGKLRRIGVYSREISELEELIPLLTYITENLEEEIKKTVANPELIRMNFLYDNVISDWEKIYNELMNKNYSNNVSETS